MATAIGSKGRDIRKYVFGAKVVVASCGIENVERTGFSNRVNFSINTVLRA